jgi:aryl-alcohol dehydrogenase-like predicted oxidoreductase
MWSALSNPDNRFSGFDMLPFDKEQGFRLVDQLRVMAGKREVSVAQLALAWLLARDAVTSVIVGATRTHQLEDNLAATQVKLSAEEIASLDAATEPPIVYPNWFIDRVRDGAVAKALER